MNKTIRPIERLKGTIELPGDKSISHRVIFIGSIAVGRTVGRNFLVADDCLRTLSAFKAMGTDISLDGKRVTVSGVGLAGLKKPDNELYLGNSGTTMRILPGVIAGQDFEATLTGDESLSKRPMKRIMEPLKMMGVLIRSKNDNGLPPLIVKGGSVKGIQYETPVASAQVKSCVLLAALYADDATSVTEPFASRDHTERMLRHFGADITTRGLATHVKGKPDLSGKEIFIPGDISSAAFFIGGASILEGSEIVIKNVGLNPTRTGFLNALERMGARIERMNYRDTVEPFGDLKIKHAQLKGITVTEREMPLLIDEVPVLCVVASQAKGRTVIKGISELKIKETDRVLSVTDNLIRMGVDIEAGEKDIVIHGRPGRLKASGLESFGDHRTAMSMAIAALMADGESEVVNTDCVDTSFPGFFQILDFLKK